MKKKPTLLKSKTLLKNKAITAEMENMLNFKNYKENQKIQILDSLIEKEYQEIGILKKILSEHKNKIRIYTYNKSKISTKGWKKYQKQ